MTELNAPARALLGSNAVAHLWTKNPDGSPQVSVVWVLIDDDVILLGASAGSRKVRNLRLNPKVVMSIEDVERNERGYQRHLIVRGTATVSDGPDEELLERLGAIYRDGERHPLQEMGDSTRTVSIAIDRISGLGPWT